MDALAPKSESLFQVAWAQFRRHRLAVWGGRILLVLYFVAAFAGFFSPYDPNYYELYPRRHHRPRGSTSWTRRRGGFPSLRLRHPSHH